MASGNKVKKIIRLKDMFLLRLAFKFQLIWRCVVQDRYFGVFGDGLPVASGDKSQDDHETSRHECHAPDDGECFVVIQSHVENPTYTQYRIYINSSKS